MDRLSIAESKHGESLRDTHDSSHTEIQPKRIKRPSRHPSASNWPLNALVRHNQRMERYYPWSNWRSMTPRAQSKACHARISKLGEAHRLALSTYHATSSTREAAQASGLSVRTVQRLVASRAGGKVLRHLQAQADSMARKVRLEEEERAEGG